MSEPMICEILGSSDGVSRRGFLCELSDETDSVSRLDARSSHIFLPHTHTFNLILLFSPLSTIWEQLSIPHHITQKVIQG